MPPNAAKSLETVSLSATPKTAVVVGATTGIGAAVARLFAKLGCRRVIIFGRNEGRAAEVIKAMKGLAPKEADIQVEFVKGDISFVKGMRAAADALETAAGTSKIDYLVMCQNGQPSGMITENADGEGIEFAVQAVSRFALSYLLTTRNAIAPGGSLMTIANPGLSLNDLKVDDLSLKARRDAGRSKPMMAFDQSKRDSTVLDSFIEEYNTRYPDHRFYHVHPGLVRTELFNADLFPFPLNWVAACGVRTIGATPDAFVKAPLYILTAPDAQKQLGSGRFFDQNLNPKALGAWAKVPKNREACWEKLVQMIGEK